MKASRWISLVLVVVVIASMVTACGKKKFDPELVNQLQAVLDDAVESSETMFPGAVLHVSSTEHGTWSGAAGLGNIETDTAMRPGDKFRTGSVIKPFVSVVILQLVEEDLISLDDTLPAVVPTATAAKFPDSDQITLRMLLNHTSGIPDWVTDAVYAEALTNIEKVWEIDEKLDLAAAYEPNFPPGEGWEYSNTEYTLLELVIEQATGKPWREEMRKRIFEPLDLDNTLLPETGNLSIPGEHARGYFFFGGEVLDVTDVDPSMAGAAGGHTQVSTATDLDRFLDAVMAGELFRNPGTLEEMLTIVDVPESAVPFGDVAGYGLGIIKYVFPDGREMFGHGGETAGYSSFVHHIPDQGITISGVGNFMDPMGVQYQIVLPALEVLIPGFEMSVRDEHAETRAALQGLLDQQVKEQDILGMAMAVRLTDGTVIGKASGYSDPAGEKAWSVDTVSGIGSVTKTFTAVVIMQLVEDGKLSLDDTIDAWFPEQPEGDKITIRMLLSHTSGIANYISGENVMEGKWTGEWAPMDLVAEANKSGPVGEPGDSDAHYSNTNYILLGLIIENITGNSWAEEIESRIIEPLDLKDTTFLSSEGVWGGIMVEGYAKTPDGYVSSLELPWYPHSSTVWAAGEVVSTVTDLMTFASALFDGKLVSRETLAVMAKPLGTDVESGRTWGLGGATIEELGPSFGMGGDIPGYHAFIIGLLDNKIVVTAMVNTQEGDVIMPGLSALQYIGQ